MIEPDMQVIRPIAHIVAGWYPQHADQDDLTSEMVLWWLENQHHIRRYQDTDLYPEKDGQRILAKCLIRVGVRFARKERAQRLGYEPDDEVFYAPRQIEDLLPTLFGEGKEKGRPEVNVGQHKPTPGDSMNRETSIADVKRAFRKLTAGERGVLRMHATGYTHREIGEQYEMTEDAAKKRVHRALRRLVMLLGGPTPYEGPGSRHAVSNTVAQAITGGDLDGEG